MRAARASGGRYAPHLPPVPVRPFRRRVGPAGAATRLSREARPAAQVAHPAGCGRRLLPAALGMCLANAPVGVPALADRLLPLPQMAPGWPAAESARRAPGEVRAREGRARDPSAAVIDSQAVKTS